MNRAVFLDRDGTIGGDGLYCHPDDFILYPFSPSAIKLLNECGYRVIVISNQSHIAYGDITMQQVEQSFVRIQQELARDGAKLDGWYICPHSPSDNCFCRKPKPYLYERAAREFNLDLKHSYMVGDTGVTDMKTALSVGCKPILVLTGLGHDSLTTFRFEWGDVEPVYVAANVLEAAKFIVDRTNNE